MTYQKQAVAIANLQAEVQAVLDQFRIRYDVAQELVAAGATVVMDDLDTPRTVWCACIVHDKPETPEIDFLTVAFEVADGAARRKQNGQVVAVCTWRNLWQELIEAYSLDAVRKACLMIALGEPQPQVPIATPEEGGPTMQDLFPIPSGDAANGCIRPMMAASDQLAAPLADVL